MTAFFPRTILILTVIIFVLSPLHSSKGLTRDDIEQLRIQGENEGWTFTVGANDATEYSLDQLCGLVEPPDWRETAHFVEFTEKGDLPAHFDWRDSAGVTSIKNQGGCGSCWAFATMGVMECQIKLKDKMEVDLSEQWLVSCNRGHMGCDGGWFSFRYFNQFTDLCGYMGAVLESDYPYLAYDAPCNCPYPHVYKLKDWNYIGSSREVIPVDQIKQAIVKYGPVACAVSVGYAFQAYNGGIFNNCGSSTINHAVVLVGWDDSEGVWIMRNSWGPNWGEDGYMRIMYNCSMIGYAACFAEYGGVGKIQFTFEDNYPAVVTPRRVTPVKIGLEGIFGTQVQPGTARMHYSINDGLFVENPMTMLADNLYIDTLPAFNCGENLKVFFTAEDSEGNIWYSHDPETPLEPQLVSEYDDFFYDSFETDKGWNVEGDAAGGNWERLSPPLPVAGMPASDYDQSGGQYATNDVNSGMTSLVSPTFDLDRDTAVLVGYARWLNNENGGAPLTDAMYVYISNNDGVSWKLVNTIGPIDQSTGGWFMDIFKPADYLTLTENMKIRFEATDFGASSQVQAVIDAVRLYEPVCFPYLCGDVNCSEDPLPDISDIVRLIDHLYISHVELCRADAADVDNSGGEPDISDITRLISFLYLNGSTPRCPY